MTKADVIAKIAIDLDVNPSDVREIAWPLIVEFVAEWIEHNQQYHELETVDLWRKETSQ